MDQFLPPGSALGPGWRPSASGDGDAPAPITALILRSHVASPDVKLDRRRQRWPSCLMRALT